MSSTSTPQVQWASQSGWDPVQKMTTYRQALISFEQRPPLRVEVGNDVAFDEAVTSTTSAAGEGASASASSTTTTPAAAVYGLGRITLLFQMGSGERMARVALWSCYHVTKVPVAGAKEESGEGEKQRVTSVDPFSPQAVSVVCPALRSVDVPLSSVVDLAVVAVPSGVSASVAVAPSPTSATGGQQKVGGGRNEAVGNTSPQTDTTCFSTLAPLRSVGVLGDCAACVAVKGSRRLFCTSGPLVTLVLKGTPFSRTAVGPPLYSLLASVVEHDVTWHEGAAVQPVKVGYRAGDATDDESGLPSSAVAWMQGQLPHPLPTAMPKFRSSTPPPAPDTVTTATTVSVATPTATINTLLASQEPQQGSLEEEEAVRTAHVVVEPEAKTVHEEAEEVAADSKRQSNHDIAKVQGVVVEEKEKEKKEVPHPVVEEVALGEERKSSTADGKKQDDETSEVVVPPPPPPAATVSAPIKGNKGAARKRGREPTTTTTSSNRKEAPPHPSPLPVDDTLLVPPTDSEGDKCPGAVQPQSHHRWMMDQIVSKQFSAEECLIHHMMTERNNDTARRLAAPAVPPPNAEKEEVVGQLREEEEEETLPSPSSDVNVLLGLRVTPLEVALAARDAVECLVPAALRSSK